MGEQGLVAIVARAPDNVLYLTNFWGMKGWDAVVFPREGEPALFCVEASADDAARTAWTSDVQLVDGYLGDDPRPPVVRTLELAAALAREHETVGLELSLGTQASTGWSASRRRTRTPGSTRSPAPSTRRLRSSRRAPADAQEIERLRLANESRGRDGSRAGAIRAGMTEAHIAAESLGFVHGEGTGWAGRSSSRSGSRLSGRVVGSRLHREVEPARSSGRATLFGSGSAPTATGPPHGDPRRRPSSPILPRARGGPAGGVRRRRRVLHPGASLAGSTAGSARDRAHRLPRPALASDLPRHRRPGARAALPAPGHRRRAPGGHGARNRARVRLDGGGGLRVEDNFLITADGAESSSVPRRSRAGMTLDRAKVWTGSVNEQALDPQSRTTRALRHDAP